MDNKRHVSRHIDPATVNTLERAGSKIIDLQASTGGGLLVPAAASDEQLDAGIEAADEYTPAVAKASGVASEVEGRREWLRRIYAAMVVKGGESVGGARMGKNPGPSMSALSDGMAARGARRDHEAAEHRRLGPHYPVPPPSPDAPAAVQAAAAEAKVLDEDKASKAAVADARVGQAAKDQQVIDDANRKATGVGVTETKPGAPLDDTQWFNVAGASRGYEVQVSSTGGFRHRTVASGDGIAAGDWIDGRPA